MPEVFLQVLKYLFLALMFLFLARAVKAMYLQIAPRSSPVASPHVSPARPTARPPGQIEVMDTGEGPSRSYEIGDEVLVGRAEKCHVVLQDTFSSQLHSRVFKKGELVMIEDLGSTNGTFLNRRKVSAPTPVSRGDIARIGRTTLQFKP